jgi:phospholipase/lecithinase/hemolysin
MLRKILLIATATSAITSFSFSSRRFANANTCASLFQLSNSAKTQNFAQIYVFGDSLSDPGNVFKASQGQFPQSPPYFRGRYADGLVWTEYLAQQLKLTANPNTNFAYGGATTGNSQQVPLGLLTQIERYQASHSHANANALYIIWAGANDYLGGGNSTNQPIENLTKAVKSLAQLGAKNILVVNLPDLGKLPGTRNTQRSGTLSNLTHQHNSQLAHALKNLRQQFKSELKVNYFDVNSLFNRAIDNPEKFGFANVTDTCLDIERSQYIICKNPAKYLFWDDIHPSTAAHKLLAETVFADRLKPAATQTMSADAD